MPSLYKKIKTKSPATAKTLKVTSGTIYGVGTGIKDNVPKNAVRDATALFIFYIVSPPVGVPISGTIIAGTAFRWYSRRY